MKKTLKIISLAAAAVVVAFMLTFYFISIKHHRSVHQELVSYLNQEFEGQLTFRDFSLSYLRSFPKIHIELRDVAVRDRNATLLKIGDLDVMLNFRSIFMKKLKISRLILSDVDFYALTDSLGQTPVLLRAKSRSADSVHSALLIDARKIEIRNGTVAFRNDIKKSRIQIRIHKADLRLRTSGDVFTLQGSLDGHLDSLISNNSVLFANQPAMGRDIIFEINRETGVKELKSGYLKSGDVELTPKLRLQPHESGQMIDLEISSNDRFDALVALFEFHLGIDLEQSNPDAKLNLVYRQSGFVNPFQRAYSELDFDITGAVFQGEDLPFPVELIHLRGNYNNGEGHSPETVELVIDSLWAEISESYIGGHMKLTNLDDPVIHAYVSSSLDLSHLIKSGKNFSIRGLIDLNLAVDGRLSELRKLHMEGTQTATGELNIKNLELVVHEGGYSVELVSGTTTLNNHVIEIATIIGAFNNSAFHFKGHLENLDQYLLRQNERLIGKLNLNFNEIDLARINLKKSEPAGDKSLFDNLPFSSMGIELAVQGRKVITPYGDIENISSDLVVDNDILEIRKLGFDFQDGHVESSGTVSFDDQGISGVTAILRGDFRRLDIILPETTDAEKKEHSSGIEIPGYIKAHLELNADRLSLAEIPVSQLGLKAKIDGREITLESLRFHAFDGNTTASGKFRFDSTGISKAALKAALDFSHLEPEKIMEQLGITPGSQTGGKKTFQLPEDLEVRLDFRANKVTYSDLVLSNTIFSLHGDDRDLEITDLHTSLPFGQLDLNLVVNEYTSEKIRYTGKANLAIDSLSVNGLLNREYIKTLTGSSSNKEKSSSKMSGGLPGNISVALNLTADHIVYDQVHITDVSLAMEYGENIEMKTLDLGFAGGTIHLNGNLKKDRSGNYPGHVYLETRELDLPEILKSFDNFNQDAFTWENSSGRISSASHHYFKMGEDLEFERNGNFWLGNVNIHRAEFDQVEPIEKALFFAGHRSKDTMIVSELNVNILLARDRLYFRDLLMNDNIANLALSGEVHLDAYEMDLWAEISLSDLLFRSKKERVAETEQGIMTLDEDSRLFLRMFGALSDHRLKLESEKKYNSHLEELAKDINSAQEAYRKSAAAMQRQADK